MNIKHPSIQTSGPATWLEAAARTHPDAIGWSWPDGAWSFATLADRVRQAAVRLQGSLGSRETLILLPGTRWATALGLYAGWYLGRRLLPMPPSLPVMEQRRLCRLAAPAALLGPDSQWARHLGCRFLDAGLLDGFGPGYPTPDRTASALLLATSGSSGKPALVLLEWPQLAAGVAASAACLPLAPGDCWLACLGLHHVGGVAILLRALAAAAEVRLHERFDPRQVWLDLQTYPVSHLSLVPAMLHQLLEVSGTIPPPAQLRAVLVGGAALDPGLARRAQEAGWPLCVSYGLTEAGSQVATFCGPEAGLQAGRVGRPLPGFQVTIHAPDPTGIGRIRLRGAPLLSGYGTPGRGLTEGWLLTGDLGRLDERGELHILGRADAVLVSGGETIHPSQIEPVLQTCPGVLEAAVSGRPDPVWGERLVAVYVGSAAPAVLAEHCRQRLSGARRPREFLPVTALPLGSTGKLDRLALRRLVAAIDPPGSALQRDFGV